MIIVDWIKHIINLATYPWWSVTLSIVVLFWAINSPKPWSKRGGIVMGLGAILFFALSLLDPNFRSVATYPDNVPIVGMLGLVGFTVWFSMNQAYENDRRIAAGLPTIEQEDSNKKVFTWPDLVYAELVALVLTTAILIVWSIYLKAPLEEPANPTSSPNPAKAPWYFLGLQEILVYYDPWMAGVLLPGMIVNGLQAIPYIDTNPKGNGYFTWKERKWEIGAFLFGFLILWVLLIFIGTFLRGPNWNFFGPYEYWDATKLVPLNNVNLSEFFWVKWVGSSLPTFWLKREALGLVLCAAYLFALPPLLAQTILRRFYLKMGVVRFMIGVNLLQFMASLPIKMYLRWLFNLKYIVYIPEFFFNI